MPGDMRAVRKMVTKGYIAGTKANMNYSRNYRNQSYFLLSQELADRNSDEAKNVNGNKNQNNADDIKPKRKKIAKAKL